MTAVPQLCSHLGFNRLRFRNQPLSNPECRCPAAAVPSPRYPHRCHLVARRHGLTVGCHSSSLQSSTPVNEDVRTCRSPRDVELVTQVSLDRWPRFVQQALAWGGPISVAVYLPCPPDHPLADVYEHHLKKLVDEFYVQSTAEAATTFSSAAESALRLTTTERSSAGSTAAAAVTSALPRLTVTPVHALRFVREGALVLPGVVPPTEDDSSQKSYEHLYPINALRNAALRAATCSHVWLVDADFIPSEGLREALLAPSWAPNPSTLNSDYQGGIKSLLELSDVQPHPVMWVVPAFELQCGASAAVAGPAPTAAIEVPDSQAAVVPRTLEELATCAAAGTRDGSRGRPVLRPFHCGRYPQPLPSIDYDQWLEDAAGIQGTVSDADDPQWMTVPYHEFFEPYGIIRRDQVPLYDERFRGYGLNKVQHAYHLSAAGFEFRVLKRHFCVTVPHARSVSYRAVFGTAADPQQRMRVERLYDMFKREMYEKYGYRYTAPAIPGGACRA